MSSTNTNNWNKPSTTSSTTTTTYTSKPAVSYGNALHSSAGSNASTWWKAWRGPLLLGVGAVAAYSWWYKDKSQKHRAMNTRDALESSANDIARGAQQFGREVDHAVKRTGDAIQRDVNQTFPSSTR